MLQDEFKQLPLSMLGRSSKVKIIAIPQVISELPLEENTGAKGKYEHREEK